MSLVQVLILSMILTVSGLAAESEGIVTITQPDGSVIYKNLKPKAQSDPKTTEQASIPPQPTSVPATTPQQPESPNSCVIPYQMHASGIIVEAVVNSTMTIKLLLDTGAGTSLLDEKFQGLLSIPDENLIGPIPAIGVGSEFLCYATHLNSIMVAGYTETQLEVLLTSSAIPGVDGLLGQNFLTNYILTIDPSKKTITFSPIGESSQLYDGKPAIWWCRSFERLRSLLSYWKNHPQPRLTLSSEQRTLWNSALARINSKTQEQYDALWTHAARIGVPLEYRTETCQ